MFSPKTENGTKMSQAQFLLNVSNVLVRAIIQEKEIQGRQVSREEMKAVLVL
jgi:hypothetical protein